MKYDFTKIIDRRGRDALAVDAVYDGSVSFGPEPPREGFSLLPMWVADMNFETVPTVVEEVQKRAAHPLFGYYFPTKEYYDSIIRWHSVRNGVTGMEERHIGYENGVLGCVCSAMTAFTAPGEKVLLHSPTYIGFTHSLEDTGRVAELSPLKKDDDGIWRMDYEDMDRRLKENHIHFAIFCSPHNPCGRVWEKWEIEKAMEVYKANDCIVISDEIWSDIILPGFKHTPTQTVSEDAKNRTIAVYAPSKTFNLAGLIGSYHVIYNDYLKDRLEKTEAATHYNEMNVLSMHALIGAYKDEGHEWTDELCKVIGENIDFAYEYMQKNFKGVEISKPQGTYMMFLHCEEFCKSKGISIDELIKRGWDTGVAWQDGASFHDPWGIRMNFALPKALVEEAMDRLTKYVFV